MSISSVFNDRLGSRGRACHNGAVAERWQPNPALGVFETLLVSGGRPVELGAHLIRLETSLGELYPDRAVPELAETINARAHGFELGSVRARVEPANGTLLPEISGTSLVAPGSPFAPRWQADRAHMVAARTLVVAGGLGAHKWADRSLLDEAQTQLPADTLPLIADTDGSVLEASRANVFAVREGTLFTPPIDGRILPGITRKRVLEIAAEEGLDTQETALRLEDLRGADEVFLTGSVRGIEPVASLDGETLGRRASDAGAITGVLASGLRRAWLGTPVA